MWIGWVENRERIATIIRQIPSLGHAQDPSNIREGIDLVRQLDYFHTRRVIDPSIEELEEFDEDATAAIIWIPLEDSHDEDSIGNTTRECVVVAEDAAENGPVLDC